MNIKYLILHHSAVSREKNAHQFDAINNYHKSKGWGMIGYHYLIEPDGQIREGRPEDMTGAHCIGHNEDSLGICLTGNFDIELPTKEQEISLVELLKKLKEKYPKAEIKHHREFANKTCPGKLLNSNWHKKETMKKLYLDTATSKQYIEGDDGVKRWIFNETALEAFHSMGIVDKNNPISVLAITGIVGKPIAIIDDDIKNI